MACPRRRSPGDAPAPADPAPLRGADARPRGSVRPPTRAPAPGEPARSGRSTTSCAHPGRCPGLRDAGPTAGASRPGDGADARGPGCSGRPGCTAGPTLRLLGCPVASVVDNDRQVDATPEALRATPPSGTLFRALAAPPVVRGPLPPGGDVRYVGPQLRRWQKDVLDAWLATDRRGIVEAVNAQGRARRRCPGGLGRADPRREGARPGADHRPAGALVLDPGDPAARPVDRASRPSRRPTRSTSATCWCRWSARRSAHDLLARPRGAAHRRRGAPVRVGARGDDAARGVRCTARPDDRRWNGRTRASTRSCGRTSAPCSTGATCAAAGPTASLAPLPARARPGGPRRRRAARSTTPCRRRSPSWRSVWPRTAARPAPFLDDVVRLQGGWRENPRAAADASAYLRAMSARRDLLATSAAKIDAVATLGPLLARSTRGLVFTHTKDDADTAANLLRAAGVATAWFHNGPRARGPSRHRARPAQRRGHGARRAEGARRGPRPAAGRRGRAARRQPDPAPAAPAGEPGPAPAAGRPASRWWSSCTPAGRSTPTTGSSRTCVAVATEVRTFDAAPAAAIAAWFVGA